MIFLHIKAKKKEKNYTQKLRISQAKNGKIRKTESYKYILLKLKNDETIGVRRFGLKGFMCSGTYTNTIQITEANIYSFLKNHGDKKLLNFDPNISRKSKTRTGIKKNQEDFLRVQENLLKVKEYQDKFIIIQVLVTLLQQVHQKKCLYMLQLKKVVYQFMLV